MGQQMSGMLSRWNPFGAQNVEPSPNSNDARVAEAGDGASSSENNRARGRRRRTSRNTANQQQHESGSGSPLNDRFFSSHFLMGGKRFETLKPDTFLFGNNADLDLLGAPVKFPYGGVSETVNVLNALVNIRRDSVKILRDESTNSTEKAYRLEFVYDCDVKCYVQIHFCAREIVDGENIKFDVRFPELKPTKKFLCEVGANQIFNKLILKPHQFDQQKMTYQGGLWFPIVIEMRTRDPTCGFKDQSQITMCVLERTQSQTCPLVLKPLKQKLIADGVVYLLQEVFGIENRETDRDRVFECSICKDNESNTLLLPCRHLCICNNCDDSFLHNVKECPICRTPVKALLTLDAVRANGSENRSSKAGNSNVEHVKLTEALNGPIVRSNSNTLSRNSISSNSTRSSHQNSQAQRYLVSDVFPQSLNENEINNHAIELQDIHIERPITPLDETTVST
ncbi:RING-type E3 ubiquitin transferase [Aphelenchoides besseyi]|nr:RING-type E3 ubiquitin transferase [Aphelenchoides besseyi]